MRGNHGRHGDESDESHHGLGLHRLARSSKWAGLVRRCRTHPFEASAETIDPSTGNTALHCAVGLRAPVDAVRALLGAARKLPGAPSPACMPNRAGRLPLHEACRHRATAEVLEELVRACPEAVLLRDGDGSQPLHIFCDRGGAVSSMEVLLEALLGTARGATMIAGKDCVLGKTPLEILDHRKNRAAFASTVESLRSMRSRERRRCDKNNNGGNRNNHRSSNHSETNHRMNNRHRNRAADWEDPERIVGEARGTDFWRKARLLLLAEHASAGPFPPGKWKDGSVLRACLAAGCCPPSLVEYALLAHGEELSEPNARGDLPLHEVCAGRGGDLLVSAVLEAHPGAAGARNGDGVFPLGAYLGRDCLKPPTQKGVLWSLVETHPLAVGSLGLGPCLYPRLLSKLAARPNQGLDAVFDVLRDTAPVLVAQQLACDRGNHSTSRVHSK
ncbi:unnamed protein product [Pseudo-nitzschia multistriata]|uniref:Uncharacterized protein n=1 Tax=Pseudo-nitzschia multistriata TaxID=183589 RepID=A0A448ZEI8_9STRA|nr:unnamed protein product [Pseudo-nitzschia multistriata]